MQNILLVEDLHDRILTDFDYLLFFIRGKCKEKLW
jgi:hypothetical protein